MRTPHLTLAAVLSTIALSTAAQTPPIKPGLWQVKSVHEVDGQKAPDMAEQFRNMPPEARKQVEAMMKARGVDMSGGGDLKVCLDKASLDQGRWRNEQSGCKTDFSAQTSSRWAWKSVCGPTSSEGETVFASPEAYTTKVNTLTTAGGKPQSSRMTMTSKWLSASCGDVQPVKPGMK